jgi:hypothetical protein
VNAPIVPRRAFSPGRRLSAILDRLHVTVTTAAEHAGVAREKLSAALNGRSELRADWLEAMPVAVVREYVTELAASIGLSVSPMGNPECESARSHRVVAELADVLRATATTDADGRRDVAECTEELREVREGIAVLRAREALLLRAIAARGEVVS